ncbi:MAG: hypothetical protein AAGJ96_01130 [Pseudomonadota bacterium]
MSGGTYTRVVRVMRIGLPILTIGVMSTIFLVSNDGNFDRVGDVFDDIAEGIFIRSGVSEARFSGLADDGTPYSIRAESATAITEDAIRFRINGLDAEGVSMAGVTSQITAVEAIFNTETGILSTEQGISGLRSDGMTFTAGAGQFRISTGTGQFADGIEILWPGGQLRSDVMAVTNVADPVNGGLKAVVTFGGGVSMRLIPADLTMDEGEN